MKKLGILAAVSLLVFFLGAPVQAAPAMGTWSSDAGDFAAGEWRELLWGGGEGQVGNEIQAASASFADPTAFLFEGALLADVQPGTSEPGTLYITTYVGGTLTLVNDISTPWSNPDDPSASFVAVLGDTTVMTTKYDEGDPMAFELETMGVIEDSPGYVVKIKARFDRGPVDVVLPDGDMPAIIYGILSSAEITITGPLAVDVKPCSCPNPLNIRSKGVLPVAILGSGGLDVMAIDPETVTLAVVACNGEPVTSVPVAIEALRYAYEDVAAPLEEGAECVVCGPDGYMDLTVKFKRQAIIAEIINLYPEVQRNDVITLSVAATLDGTVIQGEDDVIMKGKVKKVKNKYLEKNKNQHKNKNKNK
jgi:hypothetical protein